MINNSADQPSFNDGNNTKMANARTADARTMDPSSPNDMPDNSAMMCIFVDR